MIINAEYKPWLLAEPEGEASGNRIALAHCAVEQVDGERGLLVAIDGYYGAVYPVVLDDPVNDIGLVRADVLKAAWREREYKYGYEGERYSVRFAGDWAILPSETRYRRTLRGVGDFPAWRDSFAKALSRPARGPSCGLDPKRLRTLHAAMTSRSLGVQLHLFEAAIAATSLQGDKGEKVEGFSDRLWQQPTRPFGLLMQCIALPWTPVEDRSGE